jgi:hypothetical protein
MSFSNFVNEKTYSAGMKPHAIRAGTLLASLLGGYRVREWNTRFFT